MTGLGIALAVSVVQVLHDLGATEVGLKWPNDILWRGHKLAGLLLETRWNKDCEVIIGIGINVKIPSPDTTITQPWVDLYTVLGHSISRNVLAAKLIDQCYKTLILYPSQGLITFWPQWQRFDLSYGQQVTLKIPFHKNKNREIIANSNSQKMVQPKPNTISTCQEGRFITGTAWGIDEQGALLLQVGSQRRRYICGEVSLRIE
jgi:BirA family biotin operon repressor/biotin-[acetyl-CoA-carboxylase] ligase